MSCNSHLYWSKDNGFILIVAGGKILVFGQLYYFLKSKQSSQTSFRNAFYGPANNVLLNRLFFPEAEEKYFLKRVNCFFKALSPD